MDDEFKVINDKMWDENTPYKQLPNYEKVQDELFNPVYISLENLKWVLYQDISRITYANRSYEELMALFV